MKTNIILAAMAATLAFTSCSNELVNEPTVTNEKAKVKLTIQGFGISVSPSLYNGRAGVGLSRAALVANDRPLTDLYILDYMNGTLQQVLHQTSSAADFAEPDITLDYGEHTLRIIATRSTSPSLIDALGNQWSHTPNELCAVAPGATDTAPTLFTATKQLDTFAATETVTVAAGQQTAVSITLQRIVAQLCLDVTGAFPTGCSEVQVSFSEHKSLALADLSVTDAVTNQRTMDVHDLVGQTQKLAFYFLTPADGYAPDITFTMTRTAGAPFAQFTLPAVPLNRNKVTTISGNFYNHQQGVTLSINDTWDSEGHNLAI